MSNDMTINGVKLKKIPVIVDIKKLVPVSCKVKESTKLLYKNIIQHYSSDDIIRVGCQVLKDVYEKSLKK